MVPLLKDHLDEFIVNMAFMIMVIIKQEKVKCIECINKQNEMYNVSTCCTKFLKYDSFWHQIEGICHI
jgi:hypothetical protein